MPRRVHFLIGDGDEEKLEQLDVDVTVTQLRKGGNLVHTEDFYPDERATEIERQIASLYPNKKESEEV